MNSPLHISDIDELIAGLQARQELNVETVRAMNRDLTEAENARFEVGWGLLRDLLMDLNSIRNAWAEGSPAYRKTEQMLEGKTG